MISECHQSDSVETETETETETERVRSRVNGYKLDFSSWPDLPDHQILTDWMAMRKRHKADVSQTVITRYAKQRHLAKQKGLTVDECLSECVSRNWRGFESDWMANVKTQRRNSID